MYKYKDRTYKTLAALEAHLPYAPPNLGFMLKSGKYRLDNDAGIVEFYPDYSEIDTDMPFELYVIDNARAELVPGDYMSNFRGFFIDRRKFIELWVERNGGDIDKLMEKACWFIAYMFPNRRCSVS